MATSSIFHDIVIVDREQAERFVNALEEAEQRSRQATTEATRGKEKMNNEAAAICKRCGVDMVEGYVVLPCFTIRACTLCHAVEMTCADWLASLFSMVFVHVWTGKIAIVKKERARE